MPICDPSRVEMDTLLIHSHHPSFLSNIHSVLAAMSEQSVTFSFARRITEFYRKRRHSHRIVDALTPKQVQR